MDAEKWTELCLVETISELKRMQAKVEFTTDHGRALSIILTGALDEVEALYRDYLAEKT